MASTFLLVGEQERAECGAEEERENADGGVDFFGGDALDEKKNKGGKKGGEGKSSESVGRGLGEDCEVEEGAWHDDGEDYLGEKCSLKMLLKFDVQYRRRTT